MKPSERLPNYYPFNDTVLDAVDRAAADQNQQSFRELADAHGIGSGPARTHPFSSNQTIEYFHIKPMTDYDETSIRVYQAPMGISADNSTAMRAMRLFGAEPSTPLLVVGSPSVLGNRSNLLKRADFPKVAIGDLRPAVRPVLQHLFKLGVVRAQILGYSYGADAGVAMAVAANEYSIKVDKAVVMEPAGIEKRSLKTLLQDFQSCDAALQSYVDAAESQPLSEARNANASTLASAVGFLRWAGGLLRGSNIAITKGLGAGTFAETAAKALTKEPHSQLAVVWGSKSEMVHSAAMNGVMAELKTKFPDRVAGLEMNGMHHGGGDDIDLHAAMALQGLLETN